ncbi:MAG: hypothetical protein R3C52_03355 [Hyphomonadaceae bacterium]
MPLHAQILCIGGNVVFAMFFLFATGQLLDQHQTGPAFLTLVLMGAAIYSAWVLNKYRRALRRERPDANERD